MFIPVDDARLYTLAFGPRSAPALLALSGWIGSWEDWAGPLALLSDHLHVISYDHRGSGATVAPVESITFDRLVVGSGSFHSLASSGSILKLSGLR